MRKLNDMFHVDDQLRLVKTSNGEVVPEDEPLFVLRGRDSIAVDAIFLYLLRCKHRGVPKDRLDALKGVLREFLKYKMSHPEALKLPGITHGE